MKTFIPKQPKQVRERIEAKLDEKLVRKLEQYCRYLESDRDYVLAQALDLIFRKDKGFDAWLTQSRPSEEKQIRASGSGTAAASRQTE